VMCDITKKKYQGALSTSVLTLFNIIKSHNQTLLCNHVLVFLIYIVPLYDFKNL